MMKLLRVHYQSEKARERDAADAQRLLLSGRKHRSVEDRCILGRRASEKMFK